MTLPEHVAIIGAGLAGLTAAFLLSREGVNVTVLERDPRYVGGISRTVESKGFRFDIGGHRFFSKSQEVEDLWTELLGDDLLHRPRSSRIYYGGKFYAYPLKAGEALKNPRTFEDWVSNKFGRRLFGIFFKTYTEKVWGMKCSEISADWAAQRIKGLSLSTAIRAALFPKKKRRLLEPFADDQDAHRHFSLSAKGARHDVGGGGQPHAGAGGHDSHGCPCDRA